MFFFCMSDTQKSSYLNNAGADPSDAEKILLALAHSIRLSRI